LKNSETNKKLSITWEELQAMGNPENADPQPEDKSQPSFKLPLKVHYERKGRGGKEAVIIRGFEASKDHDLEEISKVIKSKMGIGGNVKDGEIILSGNNRYKVIDILNKLGFTNIKKAGG
jgi:translation initiation factor 1